MARPPVLFLDEPTTGLDPVSRAQMWQTIHRLTADGAAVLLTTQYLDEADLLADQIVLVDHGTVIARGTASEIKASTGDARIRFVLTDPTEVAAARLALEADIVEGGGALRVAAPDGLDSLTRTIERLRAAGISIAEVGLEPPSLDEAFAVLTDPTQTSNERDLAIA